MSTKKIETEISNLKKKLEQLEAQKTTKIKAKRFKCRHKGCTGCKLADLIVIQTNWYESPHGCTGGDTWHEGEINVVCPKCSTRYRILDKAIEKALHLDWLTRHKIFNNVMNEYRSHSYTSESYYRAEQINGEYFAHADTSDLAEVARIYKIDVGKFSSNNIYEIKNDKAHKPVRRSV